jgi:plasmid replication initiation protein
MVVAAAVAVGQQSARIADAFFRLEHGDRIWADKDPELRSIGARAKVAEARACITFLAHEGPRLRASTVKTLGAIGVVGDLADHVSLRACHRERTAVEIGVEEDRGRRHLRDRLALVWLVTASARQNECGRREAAQMLVARTATRRSVLGVLRPVAQRVLNGCLC